MSAYPFIVVILILVIVCEQTILKRQRKMLKELSNIEQIAFTDALTEIPNRAAYVRRLEEIEKSKNAKSEYAIALFDIDHFKYINDTFGHLTGDAVLKKCARMLTEIFDFPGCGVYRIGGDEFAVIMEGLSEKFLIERLLRISANEKNGAEFRLSKGYAFSGGGKDFSVAFKNADEMLYADKESKRELPPKMYNQFRKSNCDF